MSKINKPILKPTAGYILVTPYIQEDTPFKSLKEQSGMDQKSTVVSIGPDIVDDKGIVRKPQCKVGDVIIHVWNNSEVEIEYEKYRFVHFSQLHAVWSNAKK